MPIDTQHLHQLMDYEASREEPPANFPTLPPIPSARYTDLDFYNLERQIVFRKTWLLAGHLDEIP